MVVSQSQPTSWAIRLCGTHFSGFPAGVDTPAKRRIERDYNEIPVRVELKESCREASKLRVRKADHDVLTTHSGSGWQWISQPEAESS